MVIEIAGSTAEQPLQVLPSNDSLAVLAKLKYQLNTFPNATPDECWATVKGIEASLGCDLGFSPRERELLQHLKSAVSDVIAGHWERISVPSGVAVLTLSTLERSIRLRRSKECDQE